MKKLWVFLLFAIALTGCSSVARKENIYNLLTAPKLSRRESRIVAALNEYLGENISLKYQKPDSSISPVQLYDINSDGSSEAIVFYNNPSISGYVQFALMSQRGGQWKVNYNADGRGSEVKGITFTRLIKNKPLQIAVEYGFPDSNEKVLTVYYTDRDSVSDVQVYNCQSYAVGDVTGDGIGDIVLAGLSAVDEYTQLQIISSQGSQTVGTIAQGALLSSNTMVTNISIGKNDLRASPAIILDYTDINQFVHTQSVCLEKEEDSYEIVTLLDPDTVVKRWNFGYNIKSMDIDDDGYVETPTVIDYELCLAKDIRIMEWTSFLRQTPVRKFFGLCVGANGVYIPLPDEWQNYVQIRSDEKGVWRCSNASDNADIMTFEFVTMRNTKDEGEANTKYVNIGTLLAKFVFSENVSEEQKSYITENIFYVK